MTMFQMESIADILTIRTMYFNEHFRKELLSDVVASVLTDVLSFTSTKPDCIQGCSA